jgi:hypothetical protein
MQMYIPEIGTVITLAEDWTFKIVNEKRNASLAALLGKKTDNYYFPFGTEDNNEWGANGGFYGQRRIAVDAGSYTWPAGTSLEVDRIYIRKGNEDYSSVTFKTAVKGKVVRFFAPLNDVNRIIF